MKSSVVVWWPFESWLADSFTHEWTHCAAAVCW